MKSSRQETSRTQVHVFATMARRWALGVLCVPIAACSGRVSIGMASAALAEGGCPAPTCSFVGAWHNSGFTGQTCGTSRANAIRFDENGRWSRLVHAGADGGDAWVDAGAYTVCGDRATGPELSSEVASFAASWGCGPAADVTIGRLDNVIDAGSACIVDITPTCTPESGAQSDPPVFPFFPCTPE